MDNINLNNDMLNKLKNMLGEQQVNDAMSKISPEMVENFSNMMNNENSEKSENYDSSNNTNNIDMATLMKLKTILDKMNSKKDDPRSNLLNSLKPYLRDSRRENIDKYANLLKMADLASLLNNENNNNKKENYPYDE